MKKKKCKIVHINSKFRKNYYNTSASNFMYQFPNSIDNIFSMRLRSINIPQSMYNISDYWGNNKFMINIFKGSGPRQQKGEGLIIVPEESFEIYIPDGNWSSEDLVNYINKEYLNCDNELKYITFEIDKIIQKTHFKCVDEAPQDYKFDLIFGGADKTRALPQEFGWILGFRMAEYKNVRMLESESTFRGTNGIIYISLNDFNFNRNDSNLVFTDSACLDKDILGKVYTNKDKFTIAITDSDSKENQKIRRYFNAVRISKIHLKLFDENGSIINLNNMDWSFSLEFMCYD